MKEILEKISQNSENLSETGTIFHTILPLFDSLGWKFGMSENIVFEESTQTQKRIDVKFVSDENLFFLEAKKWNQKLSEKDFEQLTNYINSDKNCNFGILTNGNEYWIADNQKTGLENKRIYKFLISEITNCDLEILKFFTFPLQKLESLTRFVNFQNDKKEFENLECKKVFETNEIPTSSVNEIQTPSKIDISTFDNLNPKNFKTKADFFVKKVEIAIQIFEENKKDLSEFFKKCKIFKVEKPIRNPRFFEKYKIYISTNTSTKEKEKLLEKLRSFITEEERI
jgi:predicted type IV restriction endonuclease